MCWHLPGLKVIVVRQKKTQKEKKNPSSIYDFTFFTKNFFHFFLLLLSYLLDKKIINCLFKINERSGGWGRRGGGWNRNYDNNPIKGQTVSFCFLFIFFTDSEIYTIKTTATFYPSFQRKQKKYNRSKNSSAKKMNTIRTYRLLRIYFL